MQPCSLLMEAMMHTSGVQSVAMTVQEFVVKVSNLSALVCVNTLDQVLSELSLGQVSALGRNQGLENGEVRSH